jgi:hypothetical protein
MQVSAFSHSVVKYKFIIPSTGETLLASQTSVAPNEIIDKTADFCEFIGCHTCLRC